MSAQTEILTRPEVVYPDSDGQPMADNTLQFEWIVTIEGGLEALFRHDPQVFVAGNLLWYAIRGQPGESTAPDVLVDDVIEALRRFRTVDVSTLPGRQENIEFRLPAELAAI